MVETNFVNNKEDINVKTAIKIVLKDEPNYFLCGGNVPLEKTTLTFTRSEIKFKRVGQMNDYPGNECLISEASESWMARIKDPGYQDLFEIIAKHAEERLIRLFTKWRNFLFSLSDPIFSAQIRTAI